MKNEGLQNSTMEKYFEHVKMWMNCISNSNIGISGESLRQSKYVIIAGPAACGKTMFLRVLNCLHQLLNHKTYWITVDDDSDRAVSICRKLSNEIEENKDKTNVVFFDLEPANERVLNLTSNTITELIKCDNVKVFLTTHAYRDADINLEQDLFIDANYPYTPITRDRRFLHQSDVYLFLSRKKHHHDCKCDICVKTVSYAVCIKNRHLTKIKKHEVDQSVISSYIRSYAEINNRAAELLNKLNLTIDFSQMRVDTFEQLFGI